MGGASERDGRALEELQRAAGPGRVELDVTERQLAR
jgi:hypothetical protein